MKINLHVQKTSIALLAMMLTTFAVRSQAPIPDLLHYTFTGTGTAVANSASSPPAGTTTGTIMGAQTQTGSIGCNNALVGSGGASSTDYINTGWITNLPGAWTISFWTSNIASSTTLYYIFGDNTAGAFRCFTNGVAGPNNWLLRGTGMADVLITGAATTTPNLVTYVNDPLGANVVGYINGVPTVTVSQAAFSFSTATGPFKVGGYSTSTGLSSGGLMADFRIYSTALTPSQVMSIYTLCSTEINENSNLLSGLSLSPNPNTGKFSIELKNSLNKNIQIVDLIGRVILEENSSEDKVTIDISNFTSGLYYAVINSGNATGTIKVVKE